MNVFNNEAGDFMYEFIYHLVEPAAKYYHIMNRFEIIYDTLVAEAKEHKYSLAFRIDLSFSKELPEINQECIKLMQMTLAREFENSDLNVREDYESRIEEFGLENFINILIKIIEVLESPLNKVNPKLKELVAQNARITLRRFPNRDSLKLIRPIKPFAEM